MKSPETYRHSDRVVDLTGKRFGRLLVINRSPRIDHGKGRVRWICQCDCGKFVDIMSCQLTSKLRGTKSCGCLKTEAVIARNTTHGLFSVATIEAAIWQNIKQRCCNPNNPGFCRYGEKGIDICKGWESSFESFYFDVGARPFKTASIDRSDNSQGYHCGKCEQCVAKGWARNGRWATVREQAINKRTNQFLTVGNITKTLVEWSEETGVPYDRLFRRFHYSTMTPEEMIANVAYNSKRNRPKPTRAKVGKRDCGGVCDSEIRQRVAARTNWKSRITNILGQKFGRLTVFSYAGLNKYGRACWSCRCDCGNEIIAIGKDLRRNCIKSCGCLQAESRHKSTSHKMSHTPEHNAWLAMKQRCYNSNNPKYKNWGGRGIRMCQRWLDSFEAFFADMGFRPSPKHSLDRIDTNGNYEPSNCRWATEKEQNENRRNSKKKSC